MAFYKKPPTGRYLTETDKKRLAAIENSTANEWRKVKYQAIFTKDGLNQELCVMVYGKDEDEMKKHTAECLDFFQKNDKTWKLASLENMKKDDVNDEAE